MVTEPSDIALLARLIGAAPMPWQVRLLKAMRGNTLPDAVAIPTGLGKTAVMAIWLAALALDGPGPGRPRRLIYVVDRRVVVDQASDTAARLRELAAEFMPDLGADGLPVSTLRGQLADNRAWLADPSRPAIIVGTVDMIGSRLLFEGYGVSRRMRPLHAAMLGMDSLLVLDEAHLVPPFEALLRQLAADAPAYAARSGELPVAPLRLLPLSATGRAVGAAALRLDNKDLGDDENPGDKTVLQRLLARKTLHLQHDPVPAGDLPKTLARLTWQRADQGRLSCRVVIYCDHRADAAETRQAIEKLAGKPCAELLVGERRGHERDKVATWIDRHGFRPDHPADSGVTGPAFLCATAAGEVGIDLDAEHMVADVVAWERMVQRLGRVNRRGHGAAEVDLVRVLPTKPDSPTPLERRAEACVALLRELPTLPTGGHDGSPGAIEALTRRADGDKTLAKRLTGAMTPPPLRPALSRALVDAWSLTSLKEHTGRPEIGPWLRGWEDEEPQTTLIWRRFLPWRSDDAKPVKAEINAFFEQAPPERAEMLEAPSWRAIEVLRKRANVLLSGNGKGGSEPALIILSPANEFEDDAWTLKRLADFRTEDAVRRVAGRTAVVVAGLGGLSEDGLLDAEADGAPWDAPSASRGIGCTTDAPEGMAEVPLRFTRGTPGEADPPAEGWVEAHAWAIERDAEGAPTSVIRIWTPERTNAEPALAHQPQGLAKHQSAVEQAVRAIASRLGLSAAFTEVLAAAARMHDTGKDRDRWQDAFRVPKDRRPAAKSATHYVNQALLAGYRHEFGSLAHAAVDEGFRALPPGLQDLALHLIAAHHGEARPLIHPDDPDLPPSAARARAREVALCFARLHRRWGPWGLAWWEALLRAADIQASRANDAEKA